jgi:hypothetical protein
VLEDANAIGTAYLRTQLLGEPHRSRLGGLLIAYTDNLILLAGAQKDQVRRLAAIDDRLLVEIWAATAAGYDSIRQLDFSSEFVESINTVIDLDAARRAARAARVPSLVFAVLIVYLVVTAGVLGYVLHQPRGRAVAVLPLALLTLSLLLIIDIDRPLKGGINESQGPMEALRESLARTPPGAYDRWRAPTP